MMRGSLRRHSLVGLESLDKLLTDGYSGARLRESVSGLVAFWTLTQSGKWSLAVGKEGSKRLHLRPFYWIFQWMRQQRSERLLVPSGDITNAINPG